ncbi:MAG: molybdopterin oxidoreductase [Deltaproteobacteria bacterium]|nr:MAG: molybdopterin oxidoreductase [Deltaproteobacteria bacterium]
MKVDRRSFLAFGVGGAAGTALSPLPWKLTDDLSIWSQRWPWVPIPKDGEIRYETSTCTLCPGGCGIAVRMIGERPVKIEGRKDHPVNQGGVCLRGAAGLQYLYGPSRVRTPLKRVGKRGQGQWARISWEAALSELAGKLKALRNDGHPEGLACITGKDRGTVAALLKRFMTAFGTPNYFGPATSTHALETAVRTMTGQEGPVGFDLEHSDLVLSFGSGLLDGWGSPVRVFKAVSHRIERHAEVIQVDSRMSNTAARADRWIAINPGTEGVLALGMAHVIIAKSLYNQQFINQFAAGFDAFKKIVMADFTPDAVAGITGAAPGVIAELAEKFSQAKRPVALCGRGRGMVPGALSESMAVVALNALVGGINQDGGLRLLPDPAYISWPEPVMDPVALKGNQAPRLDGAGDHPVFSPATPNRFFDQLRENAARTPAILMVAEANPLYTLRDTQAVEKTLKQIPYLVSFSSFMDETARQADLILPNHMFLERFEDVPSPAGFSRPFIGLSRPVVAASYNTRHIGDTLIDLARRLKGSIAAAFRWTNYETCLKETLGRKWDGMLKNGYWMNTAASPVSWNTLFKTRSGRFEFNGEDMAAPPWKSIHVAAAGDSSAFPLVFVPYDSIRLASGSVGNAPFMTKTVPDTVLIKEEIVVEINRETAGRYHLAEGKKATLATPRGQVTVRVHLSDRIMPGLVAMPTGLGHTAYDDFLAGKGVNVNQLIGPAKDPLSGYDAAWGIRAKITKA